MLAIIIVLVFPPSESCNILVSFESLYGINFPSTNAEITFPKALKDKLIFAASLNPSPTALVCFCFSLPAKSTKLSLAPLNLWFPF